MKWIDLKEKLPNKKAVLISTIGVNGTRLTPHIAIRYNDGDWMTDAGDKPVGEVTHWQPLPEPPA